MSARLVDITVEVVPDEDPDPSYLDQEGFEDLRAAYERNEFDFVGVRAVATIKIPGATGGWILQTIRSPGLWGVESHEGEDYIAEIGEDEKNTLRHMLDQLCVEGF